MIGQAASPDGTDLTGDAYVRSYSNDLPVYQFDAVPVTVPPPLTAARVAIVTTAGLRADGLRTWQRGDQGFAVLPDDRRDFVLAHSSPNFDRTGFVADLNVVFPIDRLHELAAERVIGSVAPRHLAFMGAQPDHTLATLRLDSGPAAANLLKDDGVDVVILTPV
jgi:D-proline reductase (dithiol) PrdB